MYLSGPYVTAPGIFIWGHSLEGVGDRSPLEGFGAKVQYEVWGHCPLEAELLKQFALQILFTDFDCRKDQILKL